MTSPEPKRSPEEHDEFVRNVVANLFEVFLTPEVERRGGPEAVGPIRKAVVLLEPGTDASILLNEEADVVGSVRTTRALDAGQEITEEDFDLVHGVRPATVSDDAGWVALVVMPSGAVVAAFDFRRNRGRGRALLALADDYLASARDAERADRSGPCLDLAHTAAELAVTAMMFLTDDQPLGRQARGRHARRERWLRDFTAHGNAPATLHAAMATLGHLRSAARYGDPPLRVTPSERKVLLDAIEALLEHARARVGEPLPPVATDLPELRIEQHEDRTPT